MVRMEVRANKKKWQRTEQKFSKDEEEGSEEVRNISSATQSDTKQTDPSAKQTKESPDPIHIPSATQPKSRKRVATQSQYESRRSTRKPVGKLEENEPRSLSQPLSKKAKKVVQDEQKGQHQNIALNRSNLLAVMRLINGLNLKKTHMAAIQKTPFSLLVEVIKEKRLMESCKKYDDIVVKVMQSFDASTKKFRLGNREVSLTRDDVKLIFGICCGEEEMTELQMKKGAVALAQRLEIKEARLSITTMKEKIKQLIDSEAQQDIDDVARLVCLFICVTLLFSTTGTTVNWSYVHYMEDLDQVKKYDWAGAVVKYLIKSISTHFEDLKELKGCAVLLQYWLCEHTKLVQEKDAANSIPRLLKWNMTKLRNKLSDLELSQLSDDQVHDELQMSTVERKMYTHKENVIEACEGVGEMEGQAEDNEEKGREENQVQSDQEFGKGLDHFGTPTHFFNLVGLDPGEKVVESGSTVVLNTTASMGTVPNTVDPSVPTSDKQSTENLMAEFAKKIEKLEKEKHTLENENKRLQGENECQKSEMEALKNEIKCLKGRNMGEYEEMVKDRDACISALMKKSELLLKTKDILTQLNEHFQEED